MSNKRIKELKNLTKNELVVKIRDSETELFKLRMQKATGQLGDTGSLWKLRKDFARMKTLLSQKSKQA